VTPAVLAAGRLPAGWVTGASALPFGFAVLVFAVGLVRAGAAGRHAATAFAAVLPLALDLFVAGGLIRLGSADSFTALAVVALVIALRKLISAGVRAGARAAG
jgi:hypothetical protein